MTEAIYLASSAGCRCLGGDDENLILQLGYAIYVPSPSRRRL